jgi:ring-1,2-phenylacetyl-CoA epoxidase subunit PaaC
MVRLAAFATWRLEQFEGLRGSVDPVLAAVAERAVPELRYHQDHAVRWVLVLAGGTEESRRRTVEGVRTVWPAVCELERTVADPALLAAGAVPDPRSVWRPTEERLREVLAAADLEAPTATEPGSDVSSLLGPLLEELQAVARAHPRGRW